MLRAFPSRSHPLLSRSFLTSRCLREQDNKSNVADIKRWLKLQQDVTKKRAGELTQNAFANLALLGGKINSISGYGDIEALKAKVTACEKKIQESRYNARAAKVAYEEAVLKRSHSQKEVNDLLQRKSSWGDQELIRFTSLVREEHTYEQEEVRTKNEVSQSEQAVDQSFDELIRSILNRYHEEQVWSDKIRSVSTYGSLAVLGVNLVVFIMAILIVEPWKRRRLAQTFERKIQELSEETQQLVDGGIKDLIKHIEQQEELLNSMRNLLSENREPILPVEAEESSLEPVDAIPISDPIKKFIIENQTILITFGCTLLGALSTQLLHSLR